MTNKNSIENILKYEVYFHFVKSSGSGGQNVNKKNTKAELYFNINDSLYLDNKQKQRLIAAVGHLVHHQEWILIMTCQEERYQHANKKIVIHRFRQLLNEILPEPKKRISTKTPQREREARILDKKIRAKKKQNRQTPLVEN